MASRIHIGKEYIKLRRSLGVWTLTIEYKPSSKGPVSRAMFKRESDRKSLSHKKCQVLPILYVTKTSPPGLIRTVCGTVWQVLSQSDRRLPTSLRGRSDLSSVTKCFCVYLDLQGVARKACSALKHLAYDASL